MHDSAEAADCAMIEGADNGRRTVEGGKDPALRRSLGGSSMARHYVLSMLLLSPIHLVVITTFLAISERLEALPHAVGLNIAFLVVVNASGARGFLFAPIAKYLRGTGPLSPALRRIHVLPILSAGWAGLLTVTISAIGLFGFNIMCPGCDRAVLLPYRLWMMVIFVGYCSIFIYFAVGDYTARLRAFLFERDNVIVAASGGRLSHKLFVASIVTTVIPVSLAYLEAFVFPPARALQGLDQQAGFRYEFILSAFFAGLAFLFVLRDILRPIRALTTAVKGVRKGRFDTRAPVLSDAEIGNFATAFNDMISGLEEREFIRNAFSKYVPERVVKEILANKGALRPELRTATMLYSDIQGFTTLGERLQPDQLLSVLNEYFSVLVEIVERYRGIVLQFQGDAMLSVFNVPVANPDHGADAVRAALAIQRQLSRRRFLGDIELITRIGVTTGDVIAGLVGAGDRLGYTVYGDPVNLAARLQELNKDFGTRILVSDHTVKETKGGFAFAEIGSVRVRGHDAPVTVFTVPTESGASI